MQNRNPDENKTFDDGSKLCLLSFFVFGNYFAIFGLEHTTKALNAHFAGDKLLAENERKKAKNWAIFGLIPSTIINIALIWWTVAFTIEKITPIIQQFRDI